MKITLSNGAVYDPADYGLEDFTPEQVESIRKLDKRTKTGQSGLAKPKQEAPPLSKDDEDRILNQLELQSARPGSIPGRLASAVLSAAPKGFDPDAYLAKVRAQKASVVAPAAPEAAFDPDAYLAKLRAPPPDEKLAPKALDAVAALAKLAPGAPGQLIDTPEAQTAAANAMHGASLVGLPNALAAGDAVRHAPHDSVAGFLRDVASTQIPPSLNPVEAASPEIPFGEGFQRARDTYKQKLEDVNSANPKSAFVGQLGAGLLTANPENVGSLALQGAAQQGLQSDALAKGDVPGAIRQAGLGGAVATGLGAAGEGLGYGIGKASDAVLPPIQRGLRKAGGIMAAKATGAIGQDIKGKTLAQLAEQGNELLDKGIVTGGASKATVADRVADALPVAGKRIGDVLESADQAAANVALKPALQRPAQVGLQSAVLKPTAQSGFDWSPALSRIQAWYDALDPVAQRAAQPAFKEVGEGMLEAAQQGRGFAGANAVKSSIGKSAHWKNLDPGFAEQAKREMRGILRDEIEQQISSKASPELAQRLGDANRTYGALKLGQKGGQRYAMQKGNQLLGLSDKIVGGIGALGQAAHAGLSPTAAAVGLGAALASKVARERGASVLAANARNLSQGLTPSAVRLGIGTFAPAFARMPDTQADIANRLGDSLPEDDETLPPEPPRPMDPRIARALALAAAMGQRR